MATIIRNARMDLGIWWQYGGRFILSRTLRGLKLVVAAARSY